MFYQSKTRDSAAVLHLPGLTPAFDIRVCRVNLSTKKKKEEKGTIQFKFAQRLGLLMHNEEVWRKDHSTEA